MPMDGIQLRTVCTELMSIARTLESFSVLPVGDGLVEMDIGSSSYGAAPTVVNATFPSLHRDLYSISTRLQTLVTDPEYFVFQLSAQVSITPSCLNSALLMRL